MRDAVEVLLGFARALRHAGVAATPDRVATMLTAAETLDVTTPPGVYWAGRLALCAEPDDIPTYDAAFTAYFHDDPPTPRPAAASLPARLATPFGVEAGQDGSDDEPDPTSRQSQASRAEVLRHRDIAALSELERRELRRLLRLLEPAAAPRPSRRRRPSGRGELDPARTVRRMLRHAGEPIRLDFRRRRPVPRRLVLLLDVSGSMTPYADALLRFAHAAVRRRPTRTEAFTIGTRLTRITRGLRHRDPDAALAAAGRAIPDWSGGTRLGESVKAFLDRWGQRGMARNAVVVVFSDGWERGDPELLADQMARLRRLAHRTVWVNPHKGKDGYQPLAGGMAAALPHVDVFVTGHSFAALRELADVISR